MKKKHQFHIVSLSPWPMTASISALSSTMSMTLSMMNKKPKMINMSFMSMLMTSFQWWRDTLRETSMEGNHHKKVMEGMKLGMILFIMSEIMFFSSFFWAFFHSATTPTPEIGAFWPPKSIQPFNPTGIPLLNTLILISSGASITWSHHSILKKSMKQSKISLLITIMLGLYFTLMQGMEYWQAKFNLSDSVYGSTFFMATGFHGIHVLIGSTFLIIMMMQMNKKSNSPNHFIGFEMSAWYWHFVDIVWLFLYSTIYWWGI